jgi:hypothetical protein
MKINQRPERFGIDLMSASRQSEVSCVSLYRLHALDLRKVAIHWQVRSSSALISVQTGFHASRYWISQLNYQKELAPLHGIAPWSGQ